MIQWIHPQSSALTCSRAAPARRRVGRRERRQLARAVDAAVVLERHAEREPDRRGLGGLPGGIGPQRQVVPPGLHAAPAQEAEDQQDGDQGRHRRQIRRRHDAILRCPIVWNGARRISEIHRPGQFVIVRKGEGAERIPLTIADANPAAASRTGTNADSRSLMITSVISCIACAVSH